MATKIQMGNDEFILYIRKTSKSCSLINPDLGKKIWDWISSKDKSAGIIEEDVECLWGKDTPNTGPLKLPKTATQFEFDRSLLPKLYNYLDELGLK